MMWSGRFSFPMCDFAIRGVVQGGCFEPTCVPWHKRLSRFRLPQCEALLAAPHRESSKRLNRGHPAKALARGTRRLRYSSDPVTGGATWLAGRANGPVLRWEGRRSCVLTDHG